VCPLNLVFISIHLIRMLQGFFEKSWFFQTKTKQLSKMIFLRKVGHHKKFVKKIQQNLEQYQ